MKKTWKLIATLVLCIVAVAAYAGTVYDRDTLTLPVVTGDASWTNDVSSAGLKLLRISVDGSGIAINTITVARVTSGGAFTQACASVVTASGQGTSASFTAGYLKYGDILTFDTFLPTGSVAYLEYEVQKH